MLRTSPKSDSRLHRQQPEATNQIIRHCLADGFRFRSFRGLRPTTCQRISEKQRKAFRFQGFGVCETLDQSVVLTMQRPFLLTAAA